MKDVGIPFGEEVYYLLADADGDDVTDDNYAKGATVEFSGDAQNTEYIKSLSVVKMLTSNGDEKWYLSLASEDSGGADCRRPAAG